jgi:hypothetical protein
MRSVLPVSFTRTGDTLSFSNKAGSIIEIFVYNDGLFRVRHLPPDHKHVSTDLPCSDLPMKQFKFVLTTLGEKYIVSTAIVKLQISLEDGHFNLFWSSGENTFLKDLAFRAYEYDRNGRVCHYVEQMPGDLHYGMGERSSPLELNGKRY